MSKKQATFSYGQSNLSLIDHLTIRGRLKYAHQIILDYQKQIGLMNKSKIEVLELGCGYRGLNLVYLSKIFPDINFTGVDIIVDSSMSENIQLISNDLDFWHPQKKFDIVLSLAVIEHLLNPGNHFNLILECLKPKGMALLTTPTPSNHVIWSNFARAGFINVENVDEHKLYITQGGIKSFAKTCGLQISRFRKFQWGLNQYAILLINSKDKSGE